MLLARKPGFRPADLARVCKVSTASVADWQSGKTKSMKSEAARLAAAHFGCDQNWLSHGIGEPQWRDVAAPAPDPTPTSMSGGPPSVGALIERLGHLLQAANPQTRGAVAGLLGQYAQDPAQGLHIAHAIELLLREGGNHDPSPG